MGLILKLERPHYGHFMGGIPIREDQGGRGEVALAMLTGKCLLH